MTTIIKTEQRILNLETVSGIIKLSAEVRLSLTGEIINAYGQVLVDNAHVGSFNVSQGPEGKLSTSINVSDSVNLSDTSAAVKLLIADIEAMKVV